MVGQGALGRLQGGASRAASAQQQGQQLGVGERLAAQAGYDPAALEDYRFLEEKLPASHVIQYGLGDIADKQGRREDALKHFSAYLQWAPRTTPEYTNVLQRVEALKTP